MPIIEDIEKQFPLTMSHETDCRDVWPKRWKAIKQVVNPFSGNTTDEVGECEECGSVIDEVGDWICPRCGHDNSERIGEHV